MASNSSVNFEKALTQKNICPSDPNSKFIRKGVVGDWKNHMSDELSHKFDEWIEVNSKETGLEFIMHDFE